MFERIKDWKLKLRYGKLKTQYKHYTVIADGIVGELANGYYTFIPENGAPKRMHSDECPKCRAVMSVKTWVLDADQAIDITKNIGQQIGFSVDGKIEVYTTPPEQQPVDEPYGYDIRFTPYSDLI